VVTPLAGASTTRCPAVTLVSANSCTGALNPVTAPFVAPAVGLNGVTTSTAEGAAVCTWSTGADSRSGAPG
jgi:hypothetical protein